jgi:hypothetical protein
MGDSVFTAENVEKRAQIITQINKMTEQVLSKSLSTADGEKLYTASV